ncbi:MAG: nucleotidyl transferase AbiEii/AbiGii toxin family protein [Salinivirgaceae bacterium]|nr:nucleotidyl transferase AbiEii/AbiGii toxin family protein [Salinivirgaceae bacterium]
MENSMILHKDKNLFIKAIKETSDNFAIQDYFIEKDYWITLILKRLSESKYVYSVVFKGGTSLSKGFKLINRFSEDVDIAVLDVADITGNQLKTLIRTVEKEIAVDLEEINFEGVTSKGSRFRKAVYKYPETQKQKAGGIVSDTIIVEINSFANPYPYSKVGIQSLIGEYLQNNNQYELISKYRLEAFEVNVLDVKQTLIEKLVSLVRFSFAENSLEELSGKIRHFYDLYYLMNNKECSDYLNGKQFLTDFNAILDHDKKAFDEPQGWKQKELQESPLLNDFDTLWKTLKNVYSKELSMLAYTVIPKEQEVASNFKQLISLFLEP